MLACNFRIQGRDNRKVTPVTSQNAYLVIRGQVVTKSRQQLEVTSDGTITIKDDK
jgi:hypothetical protein